MQRVGKPKPAPQEKDVLRPLQTLILQSILLRTLKYCYASVSKENCNNGRFWQNFEFMAQRCAARHIHHFFHCVYG
jgi:hypothetical protein